MTDNEKGKISWKKIRKTPIETKADLYDWMLKEIMEYRLHISVAPPTTGFCTKVIVWWDNPITRMEHLVVPYCTDEEQLDQSLRCLKRISDRVQKRLKRMAANGR